LPRRRAIGIQVKAASVSFKLMERLFAYLAGVQENLQAISRSYFDHTLPIPLMCTD